MDLAPVSDRSDSPCSDASVLLLEGGVLEVAGEGSPRMPLPAGVEQWRNLINDCAYEQGVPPCLVAAVIGTESGGDPSAVSPAGATGLMQLMPQYFGGDQDALFDPKTNVAKGSAHLAKLLRSRKGNLVEALASYNAGSPRCGAAKGCPGNRWNLIVNCGHGGSYVDQVIARWNAAREAGYGFVPTKPRSPKPRNWSWLAFGIGIFAGVAGNAARQRWR